MAIKFIGLKDKDTVEAGSIIDDDGQRFMIVKFAEPGGDELVISMTIPLFQAFAAHLGDLAEKSATREYWRNHPRG